MIAIFMYHKMYMVHQEIVENLVVSILIWLNMVILDKYHGTQCLPYSYTTDFYMILQETAKNIIVYTKLP